MAYHLCQKIDEYENRKKKINIEIMIIPTPILILLPLFQIIRLSKYAITTEQYVCHK